MPWKSFLRTHLGAIAAAGFFSAEVLTLTGLVRYLVLFVIADRPGACRSAVWYGRRMAASRSQIS